MRKVRYTIACVLLLASITAVPTQAAPSVVLRDNFNNGKLDNWQINGPGSWSVQRHELLVDMQSAPPGVFSFATAGDPNWANYEYEFDMRGELGVDKIITFRFRDVDNLYALNIRAFGDISLQKNELGVGSTVVGENPLVFFPNVNGVSYHYKIVVAGARIELFIDGVQLFSIVDTGSTLTRGKVGFIGYFGGGGPAVNHFDNVLVRLIA